MKFSTLTVSALAVAMMVGSSGLVLAQTSVNPNYSAPIPTGSAGNSNTGPGAQPGGHTGVLGSGRDNRLTTGSPRPAPGSIDSNRPMPPGSAGNSNTGPGARPYGQ